MYETLKMILLKTALYAPNVLQYFVTVRSDTIYMFCKVEILVEVYTHVFHNLRESDTLIVKQDTSDDDLTF